MVKLNKIYTKTGDDGTTGLTDGRRVDKDDLRVRAFGDIDEANSVIGLARAVLQNLTLDAYLGDIQNDLFDLGADLSTPLPKKGAQDLEYALRMQPQQTARLERDLDALNADLSPLDSFVLPGGSPPAAYLHLARTTARRAERHIVALSKAEPVNPDAMTYINRLSDFLFVAARWCNNQGEADVKWVPGKTR